MAASRDKKTGSESTSTASIFGQDMYIQGNVYSKVDIRVDGRIDGEVECEGKLIMGNESHLDLIKLRTHRVTVNGTLQGEIFASSKVTIGKSGTLTGNVETPSLQVDEGAVVNGKITMK